MDDTDILLINALRRDGRRSVSDLALDIGVSRATVRERIRRLKEAGIIHGFSVVLSQDAQDLPIRAIMLLGISGKRTENIIARITGMPETRAIHTTNGRWDLVIELTAADLPTFDAALSRIRLIEGVEVSETNLLLTTRNRTSPNHALTS